MELEVKHSPVFTKNWDAINSNWRFILNQGGSRSSKTISILQCLIVWCLMNERKKVSIVRKTFPTLRTSVMKDFINLLKDMDLYTLKNHHKTENTYTFTNGSEVEFFAVDDEQKLRGRKRDILYANEGNELNYEEFLQLNMRTTEKLIFDFNPSDDEHWLYELLKREKETTLIKSNYLDNPFLLEAQVKEIEYLINVDEQYYRIYALGERPISKTRIYSHFKTCEVVPEANDWWYGMDFGFNAPTTLVKVMLIEGEYYCEELLYKTGLTSIDIIRELKALEINQNKYIYADTARPEIIAEMRRAGFNMKEANKDVKAGIDAIKKSIIKVSTSSINLLKEYKMYNWKTKHTENGTIILDEPVKLEDHLLDALRYAIHTHTKKQFNKKAATIFRPQIRPGDDW